MTFSSFCGIIKAVEYAVCFNLPAYISPSEQPVSSTNIMVNRWADIFEEGRMDTRVCCRCKVEKPLGEFYADKSKPLGIRGLCKLCSGIQNKERYRSPKEFDSHIHSKVCTGCGIEKSLDEFYADNRGLYGRFSKCKVCTVAHNVEHHRNSEVWKQYKREYAQSHPPSEEELAKQNARQKIYYKTPEGRASKARARHARLSRMKELLNDLTAQDWEEIKMEQNYKCAICGEEKPLHRDHIIPVSKGGAFTKSNVQGLCVNCNSRKRNK